MPVAKMTEHMSPQLLKVAERAARDPQARFFSLAHLIDEVALVGAFERLRKNVAVGVDGVTVEAYEERLAENVSSLHERLKSGRYRHQPIRRVHIPKERGKTRPIGIACVEDKIVQRAVTEVLQAIYEQDFLDCSFGFRPGRSAHDALRVLGKAAFDREANWILEVDIQSFFDSVDRSALMEMLRERVADESFLRLVGKCLHVGVLDGADFSTPDTGTTQGSILSPLLGNLYLHCVLDRWFEKEVKPRIAGRVRLLRYADDFLFLFRRPGDAERVQCVLEKRLARFGLKVSPEKTRVLSFWRPKDWTRSSKGPGTFDFLGFTHYWARTRTGPWAPRQKTRKARLRRTITSVSDWCRRHRHDSMKEQHAGLVQRLSGHYGYFAVNGNTRSIWAVHYHAQQAWYRALRRRGDRRKITWERFRLLLKDYPLPERKITVRIWG